METAETIISDALQLLMVQADEEPLEAVTAKTVIRIMNRMMARFAAEGIDLDYTPVVDLTSPITIPDGALEGLVSNLAVALWPSYRSGEVSITLAAMARSGKEVMRSLGLYITTMGYPATLPCGSGNSGIKGPFYPISTSSDLGYIVSEDGVPLVTEDGIPLIFGI